MDVLLYVTYFHLIFDVKSKSFLSFLVSPSVGNVTSNIPIQPLSPHGVMNPLEEPYLPTVQTLENEANKAADLHHVVILNQFYFFNS